MHNDECPLFSVVVAGPRARSHALFLKVLAAGPAPLNEVVPLVKTLSPATMG